MIIFNDFTQINKKGFATNNTHQDTRFRAPIPVEACSLNAAGGYF
jgi:hypothetical protein